MGAFAWALPWQMQTMQYDLMKSHGDKVFFAGWLIPKFKLNLYLYLYLHLYLYLYLYLYLF